MKKHPTADVLVNFASLRSAYESTLEAMNYPQIRTIAIIAEGIPENMTRKLNKLAIEKHVAIIGPATVSSLTLIPHIKESNYHTFFLGWWYQTWLSEDRQYWWNDG